MGVSSVVFIISFLLLLHVSFILGFIIWDDLLGYSEGLGTLKKKFHINSW